MERVVITGMGAVTPVGNTVADMWNSLLAGKNGIAPITAFDTAEHKAKVAGEVRQFDASQYIEKKEQRHMSRCSQFAVAAAAEAMEQAGLAEGGFDPYRAGTIFSSGVGGLDAMASEQRVLLQKGPRRVSPFAIPMMIANMPAAYLSIRYGLKGSSFSPVSACASGTHAVGEGMRAIRHGYLDIAVVGGTEASIIPVSVAGFSNMHALTTEEDPEKACCPFDRNRSGFVMGEGAGVLVLESLSHAKARGAEILAEIAGYGTTSDAYHITSPDPSGDCPARAMQMAVEDAGLACECVGYINAHGTSTPINDRSETDAIKRAFGAHAQKLKVSSTKSMMGHMLGAAGAVEAIVTAQAVRTGMLPPTIHLNEPEEACDLDYIPNQAIACPIEAGLSNSLGFGGHNASILIRRFAD